MVLIVIEITRVGTFYCIFANFITSKCLTSGGVRGGRFGESPTFRKVVGEKNLPKNKV